MKKYGLFCLLLWLSLLTPLYPQTEEDTETLEPDDPGIILPSIVLEIADLSVERVDAGLPEESDILLPERKLLLPGDVTLEITEPVFNVDLGDVAAGADGTDSSSAAGLNGLPGGGGSSIIAEAMLGAGNINSIVSKISFYKPGALPRFRFLFNHELLDGFAGRSAGIGYSSREDELFASLMLNLGQAELESAVTFKDLEYGLQEQGDYFSVINRFLVNRNSLKYKSGDRFSLSGSLGYDLTALILTGGDAPPLYDDPAYAITYYPPSEILLAPELKAGLYLDAVSIGLSAGYKYRKVLGSSLYDFHRVLILADLNVEFPFWLSMNGNVGYFYNSVLPMLFPFELGFSGSPSQYFSFSLRGGYFLEELNFSSLFGEYIFIDVPEPLVDNHGWFGAAAVNINLGEGSLALLLDVLVRQNSDYYAPGETTVAATGLRSVTADPERLSSEISAGVKWNLTANLNLNFAYRNLSLWREADVDADNRLELAVAYLSPDNALAVDLAALLQVGTALPVALPVVNLGVSCQVNENIKLGLAGEDLLQPLLGDRVLAGPFVAPGIKGIIKIEINF